MGWTTTHREKGVSNRDWFAREFAPTNTYKGHEILDCATIRGGEGFGAATFYAAMRDLDTGEVWAFVALTNWANDYFNFGYKDMSETMGPYEARCPIRILDLLSPTDNKDAIEWRARCREFANMPTVKAGDRIVFATELEFSNGFKGTEFVRLPGRRNLFQGTDGLRYHITDWRDRNYSKVA